MAIDFNGAEEQKEARGPIPPRSAVKVRLAVRQPKKPSPNDQCLSMATSGAEYLDTEMEVIAGSFQENKIWQNFTVNGVTDGHAKAAQISMRTLRAVCEAARGINPKDQSPQAANGRRLNAWTDLHGMEFGVIVECEISQPSRDGRRFVNNTVYRIITPDHEMYQHVMAGGEVISDKPIPEITEAAQQQSAAPSWAAPAGQARPAAPQPPRQASMQPGSWGAPPARTAAQTPPPPPPAGGAAPAWAAPAGMADDVPF